MLDTDILDLVRGKDPRDVKAITANVLWEIRGAGFGGITSLAVAALDLALWDIFSQSVGLPLTKLLGAYTDRIPMYASIAGWSGLPIEEQVARAQELVGKGISGIKVQIAHLLYMKNIVCNCYARERESGKRNCNYESSDFRQ